MARRRASLLQKTSVAIQHSDTSLANIGPASVPDEHVILVTNNARTTTGAGQTIQDGGTTGEGVQIGSITKYVNLFIQVAPRLIGVPTNSTGWLEWAFLCVKESDTTVPNTQLGTQTLGDVCTKMFRNECIWTGIIPTGQTQANSQSVQIKIPKFKQKIRIGDEWRLVCAYRSNNSADVGTDDVRLVTSCIYKNYQ